MAYRKYRNQKIIVDGITFDSKREANRYKELKLYQEKGLIKNLKLQPKFLLQDKFKYGGKSERAITYIADFSYFDIKKGKNIVEDVKGIETEVFKIKRKLFLKRYGDSYIFRIIK